MELPTLASRLVSHAERDPNRCAIASRDAAVSYAELAERVEARARLMREAGIAEASVVGITCRDDVQHLILCLAAAQLGATSCTVASHESAQQQYSSLRVAGVTARIDDRGEVTILERAAAALRDPLLSGASGGALLFSTSGTTGEPKCVRHSGAGLVAQAHRHVDTAERFACLASMEHNFVKRHRLYCVAEGATNVVLDPSLPTLAAQHRALEVSTLHVSVFQARELLGAPGIDSLRALRLKLGGSHAPSALREALRRNVTEDLQCGYGTTETGAIAFSDPRDAESAESVGAALPGVEIRVTNDTGAKAGVDELGQVSIRCQGMFLGYVGQPRLTAERLVDGWFLTGDLGRLDAAGRLHLAGRTDDMFVFNSINIHPQDIESQILQFPSVADAAVLAQPSPVHGDVPVALVVFEPNQVADVTALRAFVRARTGVRCPKRFVAVDRIPRNSAGKLLRDEARSMLGA